MNAKTIAQFAVVSEVTLSTVEGGYNSKSCLQDYGKGIVAGAITGTFWGAPAGGVGAIPGAFVGAYVGAIGGGAACIGGMLGK